MVQKYTNLVFWSLGVIVLASCSANNEWEKPVVTILENPAGEGARYPNLASDLSNESILVSWLNQTDTISTLMWSKYDQNGWSSPVVIAKGDSFFVNWADFPSIVNWEGSPLAAHWLNRVPGGTYAYHINMSMADSENRWSVTFKPHDDMSPTEHGFASFLALDSSRVFGLWLDGQNMASMAHGQMNSKDVTSDGADLSKAMTLRSTIIHRDGTKSEELEVDAAVCECCQTSITRSGNKIIAVYRNRDESETREIYKAIYDLDSDTWSEPTQLSNDGWVISGCPVNGPQIEAHEETVIATWFNAANNEPKTYAAVSMDGGRNFSEPFLLSEVNTSGRVDVSFNASGDALLTWISMGDSYSVMGTIWQNGTFGTPFSIGEIKGTRASGFPRSASIGDEFLIMWTQPDSLYRIHSVLVSES
jgi:hypothetical protein